MRILPGLTASPAAATVKKGTYPVSTRILPTAGPVFTPLKAPTRTITNPILTGPYISTQERSVAAKNVLTSVTQKPSFGPLVLPKPYVAPKPVVSKPVAMTPIETANRSAVTSMWKAAQAVPVKPVTKGQTLSQYSPLTSRAATPLETTLSKSKVGSSVLGWFNNSVQPLLQAMPKTATGRPMSITGITPAATAPTMKASAKAIDYSNRLLQTLTATAGRVMEGTGFTWTKENIQSESQLLQDDLQQIWSQPWVSPENVPTQTFQTLAGSAGLAAMIYMTAQAVQGAVSAAQFNRAIANTQHSQEYLARETLGLGFNEEITSEGLQQIYRTLVKTYHPDLHPNNPAYALRMSQVNAAYTFLKNNMPVAEPVAPGILSASSQVAMQMPATMPQNPRPEGASVQTQDFSFPAVWHSADTNFPVTVTEILHDGIQIWAHVVAAGSNTYVPMTQIIPQAVIDKSVAQPVTTQQTVAPAPIRTAIPAQATAPVSRILPLAAEAPPVSSPVATISTRQLPIAPSTTPTTQPVAAATKQPYSVDLPDGSRLTITPPVAQVTPAVREPWQMTQDEYMNRRPIPAMQGKLPETGTHPAVETVDGSIFADASDTPATHVQMIRDLGIPPERLKSGGWIVDGVYEPTARSDTMKYAEQEQAKTRVEQKQAIRRALSEGKDVPSEVLASYPDLKTSPSAAISNQETSVAIPTTATAPENAQNNVAPAAEPIMQVATITPIAEAKWGKWIDAVGTRRTDGVGGGDVETIKTPVTYRLGSGIESVRAYAPTIAAEKGIGGPFIPETGKRLELKGDPHAYYLTQLSEADAAAEGLASHSVGLASYRPFSVIEARSGNLIGHGATVKNAIGNAQETINNNKEVYADRVERQVAVHGEVANPVTVTNAAPLPAGQTTSGEVPQTVTNMAPDFATSGTGTTIPAEKNDIARITAVFDKAASAMWSGKLTPTTEGSYQKAFYDALVAAGVPKGALGWGKAITYYRETKNAHGLENRLAKVAAIVEKYNNKVLAEAMAKGREHVQTVREQQEKILGVRQADREKLAQVEQEAATRLREQQTNDRIASEIEVGKQKHIDRAVAAALAEKEANLAKTAEWLHAEKALSARNKAEIASIVEYIENLDLRYMHAAEAKAIQEEAGVAGIELKHPFVAPGDTAFVWAMQNVGLHVVDSSVPLVEQQVLNLPELRALQAKVKAIADLSKEEKDVIKTRRQEALNKEIDDCVAELSEHITEKNIPNVRTGIYHGPEKKSTIANVLDKMHEVPIFADIQFDRQQYLFQVIGGYRKRALYNSLYNKIYGADRATARSVNTDIALAHERLVQSGITPKTMSKERTLSNGIVVTQRDVIFAAVYAGNTNTLFKMMESNGWTEEDIRLSIESMSKEEVAWTNYMLDDMRMLYPQVSDAFAEINQGASLPDIMNYFPAIGEKGVDVALGQPGKAMVHPAEQMTLDSLAFYGWGQGDTLSGNKPSFVKHREGGKMVLQVDPISSYFSYKESALDYINRAPVASSMRAIVADARFKDAFLIVAGEQRYKGLMEYVEAIANPSKALAPKNSVERAARVLRWNASAGTLSLRLSKAITAFMSYGLGFGRYSPTAMLYGTHKLMGDFHGSMAEIKQYAPLLYQRLVDPVRWDALIADAERTWGASIHIDPQRLANLGFAVGDTLDVASSFMGYTWSLLRQHLNDPAWTLERASYVAERDLLQTHTSRLVQDRPAIYRGTELGQALVAFTGEATSQSMALMFDAKSAYHGKTPKAKFIAEWFTLTMGVALMGMLADAVARGRKKKTAKESGFWDGIWGRVISANIETFIPIAGRWITGSLRGFTGANNIITLKAIDEVKQLIPDIIKGNFGKATLHLLRFVGFGVGIPVLGFDELKNWINPDNAASSSSTTIQKPSKPRKPTVSKPRKP